MVCFHHHTQIVSCCRSTVYLRGAGGFSNSSKPFSYSNYPLNQTSAVKIPDSKPFSVFEDHTQASQACYNYSILFEMQITLCVIPPPQFFLCTLLIFSLQPCILDIGCPLSWTITVIHEIYFCQLKRINCSGSNVAFIFSPYGH